MDHQPHNTDKKTYVFEGYAGADKAHQLNVRIIAKKAWQYLFCRNTCLTFEFFVKVDIN